MVLIMAWRNIWRNKTRSILVMLSVIIGLWAGIFAMAFVSGMYEENLKDTIKNYLSHIQVHHREYAIEKDINKSIRISQGIKDTLDSNKKIRGISRRYIVQVMIASPINALGVNAIGIIPNEEDSVTALYKRIIQGERLLVDSRNGVLIGEKVAKKLKVKVKNKVVLSFQDVNGTIISGAFKVKGIFRSTNTAFDESNIYVLAPTMQTLCGSDLSSFHELAVLLYNNEDLPFMKSMLHNYFPSFLVQDWMDLSPELDLIVNSFNLYMYIFIGIILLALSFGIVNTMLMAVLERVRELGMLMAVGMNKQRVFFMIILETILLSLAGSPIGFAISYFSVSYFGSNGIDLSMFSEGLSGYGYASIIYPTLKISYYFEIYVMTFIAALIASLYPAIKALRLKPVEAIRKI